MKKSGIKLFGLLALTGLAISSCSRGDDDDAIVQNPTGSFIANANDFKGEINNGEVVLDASKTYKLTGFIQVNSGATLTIPAGTVIEGVNGTASYIAVAQGGKINVNGTASNPVVMTSGKATKAPGDWGGLVICGRAPINRISGGTSSAQSEVAGLNYGGTISNDNSGTIRYLRVEYAGAPFSSDKEFNGVSLFGVGSNTVFEYVQSFYGSDDGFEFFGGTVNTKYLVSIGNEDDQFDWTEGWSGTNLGWYGKVITKGNRGIEADNFENNFASTPISNPSITDITLIGPGATANSSIFTENQAAKLRRGTKVLFQNIVVKDFATGFDVEHDETLAFVGKELKVTNYMFDGVTTNAKGTKSDKSSGDVSALLSGTTTSTGAGNGSNKPDWANGWAIGF